MATILSAHPAEYYLDPMRGTETNPGTIEEPFGSLESVFASGRSFKAGDVLLLISGQHGSPTISGTNENWVTVRNAPGHTPVLSKLTVVKANHWIFDGLLLAADTRPKFSKAALFGVANDSSKIVLQNSSLCSSSDISLWSTNEWKTLPVDAIAIGGSECIIRSNHVRNTLFGITVSGASNIVQRNVIENFTGDGIRALGDYGLYENNLIKNAYNVSPNHHDGFQSWSRGPAGVGSGVVKGVTIRGNIIINNEDPDQPFRAALQGIGCFEGFYEDWVIENNLIVVDNYHGITLAGARNCRIVNNTVVDINSSRPGPPWIKIAHNKRGGFSTNNIVRNNIAASFDLKPGMAVSDHNTVFKVPQAVFFNYPYDLRLRQSSPAIDAGSDLQAPAIDLSGKQRPLPGRRGRTNLRWDAGAFEFDPGESLQRRTSFSDYQTPW